MKTINKTISVIMAIIMLITSSPVLQASGFAVDLNNAELKELKKELSVSISETLSEYKGPKSKKPIYEGIPSVAVLKERHNLALENYKINLKIHNKELSSKGIKEYTKGLEEAAKHEIEKDPSRYEDFATDKEKERVAFYTVLYKEMEQASAVKEHFDKIDDIARNACAIGILVGVFIGALGIKGSIGLYLTGISVAAISFLALLASILVPLPIPESYFNNINTSDSSEMIINKMKEQFLEDPFMAINVFGKGGVDDFALFYIKDESCAQLLYDVVDIEYLISKNQSVENMRARLYTQTVEWHYLDAKYKTSYLHNLANQLRAEAK